MSTEISPLAPQTITPRAEIMTQHGERQPQRFPSRACRTDDTQADMNKFLWQEAAAGGQAMAGCRKATCICRLTRR